tara:strand:- start:71 stop:637 length:567 start_codon:yes stop_codon:yes gene_type:complete
MSDTETKMTVNGFDVTCRIDGSVAWKRGGKSHCSTNRTFGSENKLGYMLVNVNRKRFSVHRLIAKAFLTDYSEGLEVDHINGNKSDNHPDNLRMVSRGQNMQAYLKKRKGKEYRGVSWCNRTGKWRAQVCQSGDATEAPGFHTEASAARARDAIAYANGFLPESLNFSVREAQNLLLCAIAVDNNNNN